LHAFYYKSVTANIAYWHFKVLLRVITDFTATQNIITAIIIFVNLLKEPLLSFTPNFTTVILYITSFQSHIYKLVTFECVQSLVNVRLWKLVM